MYIFSYNWIIISICDNNIISTNDILDMEKCKEFLLNFGDMKLKKDTEIINLLKEGVSKQNEIVLLFDKYVANFGQIKMLQTSMNKSELLKIGLK